MKKIIYLIALLLVIPSCEKEVEPLDSPDNGSGKILIFEGSVEDPSSPDTKVFVDQNRVVRWNADDRISIFNLTTYNYPYRYTGNDGTLSGNFEPIGDEEEGTAIGHIYSVYPYSAGTTVSGGGVLSVNMPGTQSYRANSFGPGANTMAAVTDNYTLSFKNACGYLALKLYGDNISVRRIRLQSAGGKKISGPASITIQPGEAPSVTMSSDASDAVTIVCDPPVHLGSSSSDYTSFWFALPPTTFDQGFTITVVDDRGGIYSKTTTKSLTIARNRLDWMAALKVVPEYDSDIVVFADSNFEAYCLQNFDTNHDGVVSRTEAEAVTTINVCTDNIHSLGGVEFFANLENLTCKGSGIVTRSGPFFSGQLENLDVSDNTDLTQLDCSYNQLTELDVSNNPDLTDLDCSNNPMTTLYMDPEQENTITNLEKDEGTAIVYPGPADNEIWYTTSDGNLVEPYASDVFGANIVSNTYTDGKGVITFDSPVTTIGNYAFCDRSTISSIRLPETVVSLGTSALEGCGIDNLTLHEGITSIGDWAICYCPNLTALKFPASVSDFGAGNGVGCPSLETLSVTSGNTVYDSREGCNAIIETASNTLVSGCKNTVIPDDVTTIGSYAFCGRDGLQRITVPEGVNRLRWAAFWECLDLEEVVLPNSLTNIAPMVFSSCRNLTEITIPANVAIMGSADFSGCTSLTRVTVLPVTPPAVYSSDYTPGPSPSAASSYGLQVAAPGRAPETMRTRGDVGTRTDTYGMFRNTTCPIYVPAGSVDTYKEADGWSEYADRIVGLEPTPADNEIWYTSSDGNLVEPNASNVFGAYIVSNTYTDGKGVITFDNPVTSIGIGAFGGCASLTSINIPESVTNIGEQAFVNCSSLTNIYIPEGVTSIGIGAFWRCTAITSVELPSTITTIGGSAFSDCRSLTSIAIPEGVSSIEYQTFQNCEALTSITIPENVTSIGRFAFDNCSSLTRISIPQGVTSIGVMAFAHTGLRSIIIPNSLTTIESGTFNSCFNLTRVAIPDSVTTIGEAAFSGCNLTSIVIPVNVTTIGFGAFGTCRSLTIIKVLPLTPPVIEMGNSPNSNLNIFYNSANCDIQVPSGSVDTYKSANGWSEYADRIVGLEPTPPSNEISYTSTDGNVVEPYASVFGAHIVSNTYNGGKGVITFDGPVTTIGNYAFAGCANLTSITIPEGVTSIGNSAFNSCTGLTSIKVLSSTPPEVGTNVFNRTTCSIQVPAASVDAYKAAEGWRTYADRIVAITE